MAIVKKAGAIVLSKKNPESIALLYRAKQQDWSFPKGHIEEGETSAVTMLREVKEETGLIVRLVSDELPPMEYVHPNGDYITVFMFIMQSEDDASLKTEFENDRIIWIDFKDVADKLSYDNIKEYYRKILPELEKIIVGLRSADR